MDGDILFRVEDKLQEKPTELHYRLHTRHSYTSRNPLTLANDNFNAASEIRFSALAHDDDHDSGLDGPLRTSDTSSLLSLDFSETVHFDGEDVQLLGSLANDHAAKVDQSAEAVKDTIDLDLERHLDVRFSFDADIESIFHSNIDSKDESGSLDWDYSDAVQARKELDYEVVQELGNIEDNIVKGRDRGNSDTTFFNQYFRRASNKTDISKGASSQASSSKHTERSLQFRRSVDSQPGVGIWRKRKITLVAVDGSDNGDVALDYYLDHVHKQSYIICLVHCVSIPQIPLCDEIPPREYGKMIEESKEDARFLVSQYKFRFIQLGIVHMTRIIHSSQPARSIINVADEVDAHLIVVGRRNLSKIRRNILGGVSDYLSKNAKVRVMICPPKKKSSFDCCGFPTKSTIIHLPKKRTFTNASIITDTSDCASLISTV